MKSAGVRQYRMRRRAEQVGSTRRRITEAAVRLHTSLGPSGTSIAAVAAEAGVTRLTVYRHFRDQDELFAACMTHWAASHPPPDPAAWAGDPDLDVRARRALTALYGWYQEVGAELLPIERDLERLPKAARAGRDAQTASLVAFVIGDAAGPGGRAAGRPRRRLEAALRHLTSPLTWHSLVEEQGLSLAEAVDLAVGWIEVAAEGVPVTPPRDHP